MKATLCPNGYIGATRPRIKLHGGVWQWFEEPGAYSTGIFYAAADFCSKRNKAEGRL